MDFNLKPLLEAIPKITSPYTLIAFSLLLLAFTVFTLIRTKSRVWNIIEKKFTKAQAFNFLNRLVLYVFLFACLVFLLGYFIELAKILRAKTEQTSVIIYDKTIDVSELSSIKNKTQTGYLVSTDPPFSIPAPDLQQWEKPVWVSDPETIKKFVTLSLPKEIDFKGPFFDFLSNGKFMMLFSKLPANLEINQQTSFLAGSPFEEDPLDKYPFTEPMIIKGRHHIAIVVIKKSSLPAKFKNVNTAVFVSYYLSTFMLKPDRLITTNNNAIIIATTKFHNATYNQTIQDISILKCVRFIDSGPNFILVEGACYAPESNIGIRNYILDVISKVGIPTAA